MEKERENTCDDKARHSERRLNLKEPSATGSHSGGGVIEARGCKRIKENWVLHHKNGDVKKEDWRTVWGKEDLGAKSNSRGRQEERKQEKFPGSEKKGEAFCRLIQDRGGKQVGAGILARATVYDRKIGGSGTSSTRTWNTATRTVDAKGGA